MKTIKTSPNRTKELNIVSIQFYSYTTNKTKWSQVHELDEKASIATQQVVLMLPVLLHNNPSGFDDLAEGLNSIILN